LSFFISTFLSPQQPHKFKILFFYWVSHRPYFFIALLHILFLLIDQVRLVFMFHLEGFLLVFSWVPLLRKLWFEIFHPLSSNWTYSSLVLLESTPNLGIDSISKSYILTNYGVGCPNFEIGRDLLIGLFLIFEPFYFFNISNKFKYYLARFLNWPQSQNQYFFSSSCCYLTPIPKLAPIFKLDPLVTLGFQTCLMCFPFIFSLWTLFDGWTNIQNGVLASLT